MKQLQLAGFARYILYAFLGLWLTACQWPLQPAGDIVQPQVDHRDYRYLMLDNGLKVLLVSDPGADKAAVAMDVEVGSRQDPAMHPGLAHFLEHMLFLGTERYPEAGEYQAYISAHGGRNNAYTAFENTNYFFDIAPAYLEPALDRFSEFFIAPLLRSEYIERERNAVHSEYMMGIRDDARRAQDVLRTVINPDHPFAGFSVGNLQTLADLEGEGSLRAAVQGFYQRYYGAERMALTVIGVQSLDLLENMVRARFSAVPAGAQPREPIHTPILPPDQAPQWVSLQPVREQRHLSIIWPVEDPMPHWRTQPLSYIGNILGHEGEGSLLSWLKRQGWALGLAAGTSLQYDGGATFRVTVELTEAGVVHAEQVVAAVYRDLARIRSEGALEWLYDEQAITARQLFDYREPGQPIRDASSLASNLQRYPAAQVLQGPYVMERFDADLIEAYVEQLQPARALVMLAAPEAATDRESPWYQVPYASRAVSAELLAEWSNAAVDEDITLPAPNPFITDTLELRSLEEPTAVPVRLDHTDVEVWFRQEERFRVPRTNIYLGVQSLLASQTPRQMVLTELYLRMVRDELNEFTYPAFLAGMSADLRRNLRGFTLQLSGFSPRQPLLLERVLQVLEHPQLDPDALARVIREYRDELANRAEQAPYQLLFAELENALYPDTSSLAALREALEAPVSAEELAGHGRALLAERRVQLLVHGNASREDALALADRVAETLPRAEQSEVPVDVARWPEGQWRHAVAGQHPDAALLLYLQAADTDLSSRAAFGISLQILEAPFYRQLRTEQQLGYVVMAGPYPQVKVPGAIFVAQSPVADPGRLQAAVQTFLNEWAERDAETLRPLFERHRDSLAQQLAQSPKNLAEAGQRYWQDLALEETGFDSRERLRAVVQDLEFEQWLTLFQRDVLATPRALWLYHGAPAPMATEVPAWPEFHQRAGHYRFFDQPVE